MLLRLRKLEVPLLGVLSVLLLVWASRAHSSLTVALVFASLALFWACLWSAEVLLGRRQARVLAVMGLALGWFAEQMGSSHGWFFGRYTYTEVLGPRLGDVPLAIPLMWFALCLVGYVMANLILWRQPVHPRPGLGQGVLVAWLAAMIVTAFDLGADPYFVHVLKAWVMEKPDGGWFGETLQGFVGWMCVAFAIVAGFLAWSAPSRPPAVASSVRWAAGLPIGIYAGALVFQMVWGQPPEVRAVAFFAMGMPVLVATVAWWRWTHAVQTTPRPAPAACVPSLASWERVADPLADRAVAALMGPVDAAGALSEATREHLARVNRLIAGWDHNGDLANWGCASAAQDTPEIAALRAYVAQGGALPDWADAAKVARAEDIFMEQGPLSCTLLFCASLPSCYVMPHLAEVLHISGQLEQHTEHRIRQTAAMVFPVMMRGGLMDVEGGGVAQVLKVRLIHATIRHLILRGEPGAAHGRLLAWRGGKPVRGMHDALVSHGWDVDRQGLPCNQLELAYTLLTFSYVFLRGMRTMGLGLSRADEEAFLHAWNVMGHVLGVRRELMADTMEQAAELYERMQVQARRAPVAPPDARPALGRALMATMARSISLPVVRGIPVPLTRWLIGASDARTVGVDEHVGWATRLLFFVGRVVVRGLDAAVRVFVPGFSLSRLLVRVVGYHFLTRFLLDQTRPLAMPERLLDPLAQTVAGWSDDPAAPNWLSRLEDRLTTRGPWRASRASPAAGAVRSGSDPQASRGRA